MPAAMPHPVRIEAAVGRGRRSPSQTLFSSCSPSANLFSCVMFSFLCSLLLLFSCSSSSMPSSSPSSSGGPFSMMPTTAEAAWTITYTYLPSGAAPMLAEAHLARPANQRIVLSHDSVSFNRDMSSDPTIFPGTCVSSSRNEYGWNRWKYDLVSGSSAVNALNRQITLTITGLSSFSPTENETVTCYPGAIGSKGRAYTNSYLPAEDEAVTFSIMRSPSAPKAKLALRDKREDLIRRNGFHVSLLLENDVWEPTTTNAEKLLRALTCRPTGGLAWAGDDCVWFSRIMGDPQYYGFNESQPNMFYIFVPPSETRTLNFVNRMQIEVNLPRTINDRYGLKTGFRLDLFDSDALVEVETITMIPTVSMRQTTPFVFGGMGSAVKIRDNLTNYEITESCLRGSAVKNNDCTGTLWFELIDADLPRGIVFLPPAADSMLNFNETAIWSTNMQQFLALIPTRNYGNTVDRQLDRTYTANVGLFLLGALDYDIYERDTVEIRLPYNMFALSEPPLASKKLTLTVRPDAGDIRSYYMPSVTQNSIWRGGNTIRIQLGGESFLPNAVDSILDYATGSLGSNDGWGKWKACVSNVSAGASIVFARKNTTVNKIRTEVTDYQTIVITFSPCSDYLMDSDEVITFDINNYRLPNLFKSTLPISNISMLKFTVSKSPGMYAVSGRLSYLEGEVINGTIAFSMLFLGGEFLVATGTPLWDSCVAAVADTWPTSSTQDMNGWHNADVRRQLLNGALIRQSRTQLAFQFNASSQYDTRRGESINISTMPAACFLNSKPVAASALSYIDIKPMRGTIRLGYQYDEAGSPIIWETNVTESMMRRGGLSWLVAVEGDTFDDERMNDFGTTVAYPYLTTTSLEPSGFGALKSSLIDPTAIVYERTERKLIRIPIRSTVKFDVRNDEDVTIEVNKHWMTSQQDPTNAVGSMFFTIAKSAGDVVLTDWFGKNQPVTEQDMRDGKVWFTFGLLGDQWRAERGPYLTAFSSRETSSTAFMALAEQLVPSIEFFTFSSGEAYEYLTVKLQSNERYDISRDEELQLSFPGTTVVSDLAPTFEKQTIIIRVVAGAVVLSGMTDLNEKMVRQGGVRLFLTLFGEQWLSDSVAATLCVRYAISSLLRDELFNKTLLPYTGASNTGQSAIIRETSNVISIPFSTDKTQTIAYDIAADAVDILYFGALSACVQSGIEPRRRPLRVLIQPTEGELRLESLTPSVVTEVTMRTVGLVIKLQLDGDQWADEVRYSERAADLVGGFGSLSSSITEPNGFYANRQTMLGLSLGEMPDVRITANTLEITVHPSSSYNIDNDEVLTFSVPADEYVLGGILPSPSTISFTVMSITRTIILIIDPSRPGSMSNGRYDTDTLRSKIASILSCQDLTRIHVVVNTTRSDNMVVVPLVFQGTTSTVETRNNGELGSIFMGYSLSFLDTEAGIKSLYWEDVGYAAEESSGDGTNTGGGGSKFEDSDDFVTMIWGVSAAGFVIIIVVGYFVVMRIKQAELGGMVRKGLNPVPTDRYGMMAGEGGDGGEEDEGDREIDVDEGGGFGKGKRIAKNSSGKKGGSLNDRARGAASFNGNASFGGFGSGGAPDGNDGYYPNATRMFDEKQRVMKERLAHHNTGNAKDPSNPDLVAKDPLVDRPMTLKEYAQKRLLARDADARKVQDIVDSARRRLRTVDDEEDALKAKQLLLQKRRQRSVMFSSDEDNANGNRDRSSSSAAGAAGGEGSADSDNIPTVGYAAIRRMTAEQRREELAYVDDILLKRQREAAELAARERAQRRMAGAGGRAGLRTNDDSDDEGAELYGVDKRRRATQARIDQMLEGFS